MTLLPLRALPTPWHDPLFTVAQAANLIRQPGIFLFALEDAHVIASIQPGASADILTLFTPPHRRRQGLAAQLLAAVIHQARAADSPAITLEVRTSNAPAIALYEKHRFTRRHTRKSYYSHPTEDALVFTLNLESV